MNVLHITSWYPHAGGPHETLFVQRHVEALAHYGDQTVWHITAAQGARWQLDTRKHLADRTYFFSAPIPSMFVIEWIATLMILYAWVTRDRSHTFDAINFCIAYPNCVNINFIKKIIKKPILITEHYSAYRIEFNSNAKGIDRIRNIFNHSIPVVCVSKSLSDDISRFSRNSSIPFYYVPNVVDTKHFRPSPLSIPTEGRFFAMAYWRLPKRPDVLLEAMAQLRDQGYRVTLRIGGSGEQWDRLQARISELGLTEQVRSLGPLNPEQAADEMRHAHAFLHASDYETYSAVCVEALGCGTPVIASRVGGIPEYMDEFRGRTVPVNEPATWANVIASYWDSALTVDRAAIAARMATSGSPKEVGRVYHEIIASIIGGTRST